MSNNPLIYTDPSANMAWALGAVAIIFGVNVVATGIYVGIEMNKAKNSSVQKASTFNPANYPWSDLPKKGSHPFVPPVDKAGNPVVTENVQLNRRSL